MKRYLITWTEVSKHEVEVTAEELTDLKGIALSELDETDLEDGLADDLANLDDDGFQGLERHDIEVSEL